MGWRYWLASALLYLTLIYSTGLHLTWGPEPTVRAVYFNQPPKDRFTTRFGDHGSLHEHPIHVVHSNGWKLAGFVKDQAEYQLQSRSLADGRPPYVYRFLPTVIAGAVGRATGLPLPGVFAILNVLSVLAAALVFAAYLRRFYGFDELFALLGGVLVVTMVAVTRTVSYPMLDPASILAIGVVFWMVAARNVVGFLVAAACAVATKEVLAISGLLWLAHHAQRRDLRRLAVDAALALWPVLVFVAIRLVIGGAIVSHDGHDVAAGDLPPYAERVLTASGIASLLARTGLAFGVMWLGLVSARRYPMLARHAVIIPPVLLAAYLLSLQITRVLGVVYPVVIPGAMLLFRDWAMPSRR